MTHGTPRLEHAWSRPEAVDRPAAPHPNVVARTLARFPFTAALLLVLGIVGLVMGLIGRPGLHQAVDAIGFDLQALKSGRLYVLMPGTLVQDKPWLPWRVLLMVAVFVPPLELIAGSRRAAITFFLTDWISTFLSVPVLAVAATLGSARADIYIHTPGVGSSSAAFGCISAFAAALPGKQRILAISLLAAYLVPALFLVKHVYSVEHLISAVVGFALGLFWARSPPAKRRNHRLRVFIQNELGGAPRKPHGNLH